MKEAKKSILEKSYELQLNNINKLVKKNKQNKLNTATDNLLKLHSLILSEQSVEDDLMLLDDEIFLKTIDDLDNELFEITYNSAVINEFEMKDIKTNTEHITDKAIEYYINAKKKVQQQLVDDVHYIRELTEEQLKNYIDDLKNKI